MAGSGNGDVAAKGRRSFLRDDDYENSISRKVLAVNVYLMYIRMITESVEWMQAAEMQMQELDPLHRMDRKRALAQIGWIMIKNSA